MSLTKEELLLEAIENGNLLKVQELMTTTNGEITILSQARDCHGRNAFGVACMSGYLEIVKFLTKECKMNVREFSDQSNAIMIAGKYGHTTILKYIADQCGVDMNEFIGDGTSERTIGESLIHLASSTGHLNVVHYLHKCWGVDVNTIDGAQSTCLMTALASNHLDIVDYFLEQGHADISRQDFRGRTALHYSIREQRTVLRLLNCGADPNSEDYQQTIPMQLAAYSGYLDSVKLLCWKGSLQSALVTSTHYIRYRGDDWELMERYILIQPFREILLALLSVRAVPKIGKGNLLKCFNQDLFEVLMMMLARIMIS
jgi:ankyrin repeat protein